MILGYYGTKLSRDSFENLCYTRLHLLSIQERSYSGVSLARLEITSRNEEAVNSTRNKIYSVKLFTSYFIDVDTFYLFLN